MVRNGTRGGGGSRGRPSSRASSCGRGRAKLAEQGGRRNFAVLGKMPSAKAQMDEKRRQDESVAIEKYIGPPPSDPDLIQATLVLPGKHMIPRRLEDPSTLDDIRKKHEVWITQDPEPNVIQIHSRYIGSLKEAMKDMQWAIHDMRLENQLNSKFFMVQIPTQATADDIVTVKLDSRPVVENAVSFSNGSSAAAADLMEQLRPYFFLSTERLMNMKKNIAMRVEFGLLNVQTRKKSLGDKMSYSDFVDMVSHYAMRGGACLNSRLEDIGLARGMMQHLVDPRTMVWGGEGHELVRYCDSLTFKLQDLELVSEIMDSPSSPLILLAPKLTKLDKLSPLQWVVAAPDRKYDWCLTAEASEPIIPLPSAMQKLIEGTSICYASTDEVDQLWNIPLDIKIASMETSACAVDETRLKRAIVIPFRDTPFAVEVSINHSWEGLSTGQPASTWWCISMYGVHWEEAINQVSPGDSKKSWGEGQQEVWRGSTDDAEEGFEEFIRHILEILSALESVDKGEPPQDD